MTRNNAREIAVQITYALAITGRPASETLEQWIDRNYFKSLAPELDLYLEFPNVKQKEYICALVQGADEHAAELDGYIAKYSVGWDFARISMMANAVMRVAMYEILYMPDVPNSAAISEAVSLIKKYDEQKTASFVNGILGTFVRTELPETAAAPEKKE